MSCDHKCPMFNDELAAEMIASLASIKADLEGIKKTLFGNGQPGKCQMHDNSISELKEAIAEDKGRRGVLAVAISTIVAALVSFGVATFVWFLGRH